MTWCGSTEDRATDAQVDEVKAAGCRLAHQEHGSGASPSRPVLAKLMRDSRMCDTPLWRYSAQNLQGRRQR
ncbi:hypothetical protein NKH93_21230 [Mesorhizobium sp. M0954]|uniref:hypothetical protein n=1 Tax=Mesorhizobium sp. M0954 TaxID=2957032 RepID=UPI003337193B